MPVINRTAGPVRARDYCLIPGCTHSQHGERATGTREDLVAALRNVTHAYLAAQMPEDDYRWASRSINVQLGVLEYVEAKDADFTPPTGAVYRVVSLHDSGKISVTVTTDRVVAQLAHDEMNSSDVAEIVTQEPQTRNPNRPRTVSVTGYAHHTFNL